ncbi:unnamed protein product [Albugo candida]|uniref:Uncharacterized protein n=1 Tax=Albugo candida TaxID=65357 RepID=A0A024FW49_9STRA|nr:unnamed protein product [Albugo candida]|eukprot:CCI11383.1 unnamed protein product [Albugo candida]
MCQLQTDTRQFPSRIESHRKVSVIEYSISVLSIQIDSKVSGKPHTDALHVINPVLQSYKKIGFFFADGYNVASFNVHSVEKAGKKQFDKSSTFTSSNAITRRPNTIPHHPIHSSDPRRFVCLSCSFQCERCLALHSTSFELIKSFRQTRKHWKLQAHQSMRPLRDFTETMKSDAIMKTKGIKTKQISDLLYQVWRMFC